MRPLLPLLLLTLAPALHAQADSSTRSGSPIPFDIKIAAPAQAYMGEVVRRDTVASFCALDEETTATEMRIYAVARAARAVEPECGGRLPILARAECALHVRESVWPRILLICREGKFYVERKAK